MVPYVVMICIILICICLESLCWNEHIKRILFIVSIIPVFVLIGFKSYQVGTDTPNYLLSFKQLIQYGDLDVLEDRGYDRVEIGYKYFIYILSKISQNAQILLIVVAFIVCFSLYKFIWKNAQNRSLALFFFVSMGFFQFAMSGIRQTIAISITLLSYKYIQKKKFILFLLFVGLAYLFHKSVVVVIPMYFIANQEFNKKRIFIAFFFMLVLFFVADKLLLTFSSTMGYEYGIEETGNGYTFFLIVLLITLLGIFSNKTLILSNQYNQLVLNSNFLALALWLVRLISRTAERVSLYFMPYTYLLLEEYLSTRSKREKPLYIFIAVFLASILFFKRISGQPDLCNFRFCFE